ncbi:MAG: hypothetical protein LBR80_17105 [Deltaproteobacteria bacterium]|jgi:hypothetical protein|nr:hypothetical protein [Deltaproteobacteria bacterium]
MTNNHEDLPLDIDKIVKELTDLHIDFIQQVEDHKDRNEGIITIDELENIFSVYYNKREKIIQYTHEYFRGLVLKNMKRK